MSWAHEFVELDNAMHDRASFDCGEAEFRISEGSDEYVQLEALLAKFALVGAEN